MWFGAGWVDIGAELRLDELLAQVGDQADHALSQQLADIVPNEVVEEPAEPEVPEPTEQP